MAKNSMRERTPFGQRMLLARKAAKLTQKQVEAATEISQSTLSEIETTAHSSGYTAQLAQLYGADPYLLATGQSSQAGGDLDQLVSHALPHTPPHTLTVEEIKMGADLSQPFELEVVDDALAPDIFKGCVAIMDASRPPEPAWPVLVRDKFGGIWLRDYEVGPGGTWSAVPRAPGYKPLHSEEHGLTLLASMDGYKRPRKG